MPSSPKHSVIESRGLDTNQINEIAQLAEICNRYDGLDLKLNWSILRHRPVDQLNDFLYYEDGQLVGFLPLFSFSLQEGEVSGMVHPQYRQRGIFKTLFEAACQESRRRTLPSLLLIVAHASATGQAFARRLPTTYDHSEYKMILAEPRLPQTSNKQLQFRSARREDLPALTSITARAFGILEDDIDWYPEDSLTQTNRKYYVGEVDGKIVGKIDVSLSDNGSLILGFAVHPKEQKKGYGRQILACTIQELLKSEPQQIWLEVSTDNTNALGLYRSCGFKETSSDDYYRLQLS